MNQLLSLSFIYHQHLIIINNYLELINTVIIQDLQILNSKDFFYYLHFVSPVFSV